MKKHQGEPKAVLLVEDNPGDARLIKELLEEAEETAFELEWVDRLGQAIDFFKTNKTDVILLNLSLPDSYGIDTLKYLHARVPRVPIVVITGLDDKALAIKSVHLGAQDYLVKGQVNSTLLERSLRHAMERHSMFMELKKKKKELKNSRQKFRRVIEKNADGLVIVSTDGDILFVNHALESILGRCPMKLRQIISDFIKSSSESNEVEIPLSNGEFHVFKLNKIFAEWEGENAYLVSVRDITTFKQIQKMLDSYEQRYRILVDNNLAGIYRINYHGTILDSNDVFARIFGYDSRKQILNLCIWDFYLKKEDSENFLIQLDHLKNLKNYELNLRRRDGTPIRVLINAVLLKEKADKIILGTLIDITEFRAAQEKLGQSLQKLQNTMDEIILAMAKTIEVKDTYTAKHQQRVAKLAQAIAERMNLSKAQIDAIRFASTIHDIGKIGTPSEFLSKSSPLTEHEFNIIKTHAQIGYEILKTIEFPWPIAQILLQHHERLDGSGYPSGLKENQILLEAKILAVADVVEAMSSHRPYRPALGIEKALQEVCEKQGILYDQAVVEACIDLFNEQKFSF